MGKQRFEITGVIFLFGILSLASTHPLIFNFDTGIPYDSISGVKAWNRSGDQLQILYWFWLVKENILGTVPFNTNPFEFNMAIPHDTTGFATSPLAFIYILFSPLGDIAAYNCTIITTYILAGTFMYLLIKIYSGSIMGALLGAFIFTFAPSRINGVTGGNMYGMLFFLYPWIFYFLEKGIRSKKIRYGILSGIGLICLSMLEAHLLYYICIFLAAYIPLRVLILFSENKFSDHISLVITDSTQNLSVAKSLWIIWGCGLIATCYSQILFTFRDNKPFISSFSVWIFLAYPLILVAMSLFLTSLYQRLFSIEYRKAFTLEAKSLSPIFFLVPLSLFVMYGGEIDTDILVSSICISVVILKIFFLRDKLFSFGRMIGSGLIAQRANLWPILPLILAMGYILVWLPMSKAGKFESTIAAAGRTLHDVRLYSAKLSDVISPDSNVYIGIVSVLIIGVIFTNSLYSVLRKKEYSEIVNTTEVLSNFYLFVAFTSFLLSLGLAFGKSSLYLLLYNYLPYFNYPRVSDRIIILALFAIAILSGYIVKKIQEQCGKPWIFFFNLVVLIFALGQLKDFKFFQPTGINILDKGQDIYTHVSDNIGDGLLLEIPLWPGDSHQSSLYQHYIMQDKIPRVNGYSPLVRNDYINTVFKPLASMNKGRLDKEQWEILHKLGVKYITVHNNHDIFPKKVSPFGPITTSRRFKNSPYLEFVELDNHMHFKDFSKRNRKLYLFRVKSAAEIYSGGEKDSWYEMPYYYYVRNRLHHLTGEIVVDNLTGKKVFQAKEGKHKSGFLVYGPYAYYTPGNYRTYFEMSIEKSKSTQIDKLKNKSEAISVDRQIARIEVVEVASDGTLSVLSQKDLGVVDLPGNDRRVYLDFTLQEFAKLEFRVFYYGHGDVKLEQVMVFHQNMDTPRYFLAAEKMVGETGEVVEAQGSTTGRIIESVIRQSKKGAMVYGPNAIYPQGSYRARYYLKLKNTDKLDKTAVAAVISVTHGKKRELITQREIYASEMNEQLFKGYELEFTISDSEDLGFPVVFTGKANIQLDKIEIERSND